MMEQSFALFETAIGTCGIIWGPRGIVGVQLPEADAAATRARVRRRYPAANEAPPPPDVRHAIDGIVALLDGEKRDLTDIEIDDSGLPDFNKRVYCDCPQDPARRHHDLWRDCGAARRQDLVARSGAGDGRESDAGHHAVSSGHLRPAARPAAFPQAVGSLPSLRLLTIEGAQPGGPTLFENLPLMARKRGS